MGEIIPGVAVVAVVLADRPPLPLAEVGSPFLPGDVRLTRVVQPFLLGDIHQRAHRSPPHMGSSRRSTHWPAASGFGRSRRERRRRTEHRAPAPALRDGEAARQANLPQMRHLRKLPWTRASAVTTGCGAALAGCQAGRTPNSRHILRRRRTCSCASERTSEALTDATSSSEILSRSRASARARASSALASSMRSAGMAISVTMATV